jgi:hypothetical protein
MRMFERFRSAVFNRQRRKWDKRRKYGKQSFILYWGVLKWGGIMFILSSITNVLGRHRKLDWHFVVSMLIACPLAGYVWARATWYLKEKRFYGAARQQDSIKES